MFQDGVMIYPHVLLFLCPIISIAACIDAIAGGGGIITIPAYLYAGLPIHSAYGTNKFAMSIGTSLSAYTYFKSGHVALAASFTAGCTALVGSWFGTQLALFLSADILKISLLILLPVVMLFVLFKGHVLLCAVRAEKPTAAPLLYIQCSIIGILLGAYDGFFGPGTGMFLLLAFSIITKYDTVTASGNAKIVNLCSNSAALVAYMINGKVLYHIALPCALAALAGNFIGSRLAIKKGISLIRIFLIIVALLLCAKLIIDLIM